MMAKPSVLLPEPLGPIRACISPRLNLQVHAVEDRLALDGDVQVR